MSLEDFSPDLESGSEGSGNSAEAGAEAQEKARKKAAAAGAGIKRTKKDEQKAKKHDFLLAGFLIKIIINKKYDPILDYIFTATNSGFPSNFVVGILSLINLEISDRIRDGSGKKHIQFNYNSEDKKVFDDHHLDPEIKNRINYWIEDIIDAVTIDNSSINTAKTMLLLSDNSVESMLEDDGVFALFNDDKNNIDPNIILNLISGVFRFFLTEINIQVAEGKAKGISDFILSEVKKEIKKVDIEEI